MTTVHVLETVARHAALGLRFWDVATGSSVVDGLDVALFPRANPNARTWLRASASGVYVAQAVPGLRSFEFSNDPPDAVWATPKKPYRVELSDPEGRYLPSAFDADLPARGLLGLIAPWLPSSPPLLPAGVVPLFSAPARPLPEPLGVVWAQLVGSPGTELEFAL